MTYSYNQLVADLENILVDESPSTEFTDILPSAIQYAENRIYKKLVMLCTRTSDFSVSCTPSSREVTIPSTIVVVEGLSVITPAATNPSAGTRNPCERASLDFIDMIWPVESTTGLPTWFAMKTDATAVLAPTPGAAYKLEFTGIFQPTPLSASNQTTYLTNNYPQLMLAACMVFLSGWQKNYGSQSDDPSNALSWESQYQMQEAIAFDEEQRRKSLGVQGTAHPPAPMTKA